MRFLEFLLVFSPYFFQLVTTRYKIVSITTSIFFVPTSAGFFLSSPVKSPALRVMRVSSLARRTTMLILPMNGVPCIITFC